tara:strand:- start:292 stop:510 length:219 start_codon:yes stop_codon:yes gene_type:complete
MEVLTNQMGNPTAILIERLFWFGLGGFLCLAIITSLIRGSKEKENKTKPVSPQQLEKLAKKAIKQNIDRNLN